MRRKSETPEDRERGLIKKRMKRNDKLRSESDDQLKIIHSQKSQAKTVSEHNHRGVYQVGTVVTNMKVITHHRPNGVKGNNVGDNKRAKTPLFAIIEGRGVSGPDDNGRLLMYKEKKSSIDGREWSDGKSDDREIDEGGDDFGNENSKVRSGDCGIDVRGDDYRDEESKYG